MSKRKYLRRHVFIPFVVFRMFLSLIIFALLAAGVYTAYKHFSGYDPAGLNTNKLFVYFSNKIFNFVPKKEDDQPPASQQTEIQNQQDIKQVPRSVYFKFILVADSHNDNENLAKALKQAGKDVKFALGLGDYTEVGTDQELMEVKKKFDAAGLQYFVTVGDHDLWDSRDKGKNPADNFIKFFGPTFQSFSYGKVRFIMIDNSDNYKGLGDGQINWLRQELERIKNEKTSFILVMMHEPLYHPSASRIMGKTNPSLKDQARVVMKMLKDANINAIFAGDTHYFTEYNDFETNILMYTIGAITSERNAQTPRFARVTIFSDGSLEVEDVEVK